jgi:hypothetical protein
MVADVEKWPGTPGGPGPGCHDGNDAVMADRIPEQAAKNPQISNACILDMPWTS